jgi:hypothetical protein
MAIRFFCSTCGQKFEVADSMAGRNARCPRCRGITEIPAVRPVQRIEAAGRTPSVGAPIQQKPTRRQPPSAETDDDIYLLVDELPDDEPLESQPVPPSAIHPSRPAESATDLTSAQWPPSQTGAPGNADGEYDLAPIDDPLPEPAAAGTVATQGSSKQPAAGAEDDLSDLIVDEPALPMTYAFAAPQADPNQLVFTEDDLIPIDDAPAFDALGSDLRESTLPGPDALGSDIRRTYCPGCLAELTTASSICNDCGLDFRTGRKVPR